MRAKSMTKVTLTDEHGTQYVRKYDVPEWDLLDCATDFRDMIIDDTSPVIVSMLVERESE